jgi:hypothetical protein
MSLKLIIEKTVPNMVVHSVDHEEIWASSSYTLYRSKDGGSTFDKVVDLKVPPIMRMLGRFRLSSKALRLGIRSLRILKSGTILAIADRKIFRGREDKFDVVYSFKKGFGPLPEGWCEDDKGHCYLAEYFLNNRRNTVSDLLKSSGDGQSWRVIRSLPNVRHIHCVQYDPFGRRVWMGTGDRDEESSISFSEDGGKSWTEIGSGDQMFRTVSLLFTEDYVYWGTDAPTRQNYIYVYNRESGQIERLSPVGGPIHHATILGNGIKLFATASEGNSEGKNPQWDSKAHIWASQDGIHWEDVMSWEKDFWPYILGYGMVLFAQGRRGDNVYFTAQSLRKVDGMLMHARLFLNSEARPDCALN